LVVCSCFDVCWSFGVAGLGWYPCSRLQLYGIRMLKTWLKTRRPYLRYLTTRAETDKLEYKRLVAILKRETRKIKRQCWETFVSRIEHDLHGRQINAYKIIRNFNGTEKDNLRLNPIV